MIRTRRPYSILNLLERRSLTWNKSDGENITIIGGVINTVAYFIVDVWSYMIETIESDNIRGLCG